MTAPIDLATDADIAEALRLDREADAIKGLRNGAARGIPSARWVLAARVLLPKLAAHLAALRAAGKAFFACAAALDPGACEAAMATLRALCGDGPTDLVLVPAAELARLRGEVADAHVKLDQIGALTHMIGTGSDENQRATLAERIEDVRRDMRGLSDDLTAARAPIHYAAVGHLCDAWERGARSTSDHAFVTCGDCREHFLPDDHEQGIRATRFGEECPACTVKLPPRDDGDTVKCSECNTEFLRADGPPALFPMEPEVSQ